ncbi:MAG: hypothetical protein QM679_10995 [Patulibacter sp.]
MVRDETGQATIEQLGLMLLIALVLIAATAITAVAAPGLVNRVTTAMQRALCVVGAESCPVLDREPCPLLRTDRTVTTRASVGVLRLGDDRALTIERRSDGSYVIGLLEGVGAGAGVTVGAHGAQASADGLLTARAGRTWKVADRTAATALVERLRHRALPAVDNVVAGLADLTGLANADPQVDSYTLAGKAAGDATAKLGFGPIAEAGTSGDAGVEVGVQIAAHRKAATAYISLDGRIGAFFDGLPAASLPLDRRGKRSGSGGGDDEVTVLNPDKLELEAQGFARGTIALHLEPGPRVTEIEITGLTVDGDSGRELHARVDPSSPDVAAALAAWRKHPGDPALLQALGAAAASSAALDERGYVVASEERESGAEVGIGLSLGLTVEQQLRSYQLVEQRTRPVGGLWEERLDCVA